MHSGSSGPVVPIPCTRFAGKRDQQGNAAHGKTDQEDIADGGKQRNLSADSG